MPPIKVRELTLETFERYGRFAMMVNPDPNRHPAIGEDPILFFRDMVTQDLGSSTIAAFSTCQVRPRAMQVDVTEFHTGTGEAILPLDGDIIIHVHIATTDEGDKPPLDSLEAFFVPQGTLVVLDRGVWHHAPLAIGDQIVSTLIVLPPRTYYDDCVAMDLKEDLGEEPIIIEE